MRCRRQFFQILTAALLATVTLGNSFAAPPPGKGGGGGGGDSTAATTSYELKFLTTPSWITSPYASGSNNYGDIVGYGTDPSSDYGPSKYRAYLYTESAGFVDVNSFPAMANWPDWTAAEASAINDVGQMGVTMIHQDGTMALFLYEATDQSLTMIDIIGDFFTDGRVRSFINTWGDIAYNKYDASGASSWHLYSYSYPYSPESIQDLGIPGIPNDINAAGEIVGVVGGDVVRYSTTTGATPVAHSAIEPRVNDAGDLSLSVDTNGKQKYQPNRYVEAIGTLEVLNSSWRAKDINSASDVCFYDSKDNWFVFQPEVGNVGISIAGTNIDLQKWNGKATKTMQCYMVDRDATGFGRMCGSAIVSDGAVSGREVFVLTPIPAP